jgi:hypothetical protein
VPAFDKAFVFYPCKNTVKTPFSIWNNIFLFVIPFFNYTITIMKSDAAIKKLIEQRSLPKEFLKWITDRHIFEFFGISPQTLKNWRRLHKVTYSRFCGIILYDADDLLAEIESRKVLRKA